MSIFSGCYQRDVHICHVSCQPSPTIHNFSIPILSSKGPSNQHHLLTKVIFDAGSPGPSVGATLLVAIWCPEIERLAALPPQVSCLGKDSVDEFVSYTKG